ncbi:hypothetical protein GA0070607_2880 [Micromonospora coriariae]|uniref:Uncharacterized protein n=1 Tax=Micromonospora coriariae TaxID=285665 RepID=A0A1C4VYV8_9ACTN|nr:hypothetical protein [Micromonospora coriariae]SCE89128.1 hypothetical protein GA0070607_2880 [Micromonospora coriariae]
MQPPAGSQVSRVPAQRTPSEQLPPAPAAPAPQRPRRRARTVLTVVAGVLALLCLGAVATAYVLYGRASTPDRSAPDVVVDNYLRAFLVDRNDARADAFTCKAGGQLEPLRLLRSDLIEREERFDVTISVSWGSLAVQKQGEIAAVQVTLIISAFVDGINQSDRQSWQFDTRHDDGWRVCGGTRAG